MAFTCLSTTVIFFIPSIYIYFTEKIEYYGVAIEEWHTNSHLELIIDLNSVIQIVIILYFDREIWNTISGFVPFLPSRSKVIFVKSITNAAH